MAVISISDLTISYGDITAVNELSFTVEPGQVVGLLGGNGAGKSSTLRAVAGVNPHTAGSLTVNGYDLADRRQAEHARSVIGYCPDVGGLIRQATVREHIALALSFRGHTDRWPQAMDLVDRFGLGHVFDKTTRGFSHGMCRRLSVLLAVLTAESALILDEPFDGVDPVGVETTMSTLAAAKTAGVAVLVSTHLLPLLVEASDELIVLANGQKVDHDSSDAFAGDVGAERYRGLIKQFSDHELVGQR